MSTVCKNVCVKYVNTCVCKKCEQMCVWKMCGKSVPEWLSKTSVKHNTFARHLFHTFFIRFSNLFSRARAFCNFTFTRKFSHHMLDISTHIYVLDLCFTRTSWTLFHTCILDMFSHPYFWPPCPIPSPSRGDLGLICSVEAFSVHLQTVELPCGSIPKTYKHIQSQYRQIIHRPKGPWHIMRKWQTQLDECLQFFTTRFVPTGTCSSGLSQCHTSKWNGAHTRPQWFSHNGPRVRAYIAGQFKMFLNLQI